MGCSESKTVPKKGQAPQRRVKSPVNEPSNKPAPARTGSTSTTQNEPFDMAQVVDTEDLQTQNDQTAQTSHSSFSTPVQAPLSATAKAGPNDSEDEALSLDHDPLAPAICVVDPSGGEGKLLRRASMGGQSVGGQSCYSMASSFDSMSGTRTGPNPQALFQYIDLEEYQLGLDGMTRLLAASPVDSSDHVVASLSMSVLQSVCSCEPPMDIDASPKSIRSARKWLSKQAKVGSVTAHMALAEFARAMGDAAKEVRHREDAAKTGHPLAKLRHAVANMRDLREALAGKAITMPEFISCREIVLDDLKALAKLETKVGGKAARVLWPIYYKGSEGIKKDVPRARQLLERAIALEDDDLQADRLRGHLSKFNNRTGDDAAAAATMWRRGSTYSQPADNLSKTYSFNDNGSLASMARKNSVKMDAARAREDAQIMKMLGVGAHISNGQSQDERRQSHAAITAQMMTTSRMGRRGSSVRSTGSRRSSSYGSRRGSRSHF
eukprot:TRINITY_DN18309_c0_g1_i1.p1 TRINITY_DN18309_c0_g1~~TRINITY_DN18309_c0_g1_i1.p1  ORF type:complete len:575 (+),score=140.42 TRINITY_DN18309_c0_g1_i1:244-1725(+)